MNKLELKKQSKPEFEELGKMLADLNEFLDEEANFNDVEWNEHLDVIVDFQDLDGSFKLFDTFKIPSDARVDFCYTPTYLCCAILMKAYLSHSDSFTFKKKAALAEGLKISTARNLAGHGYEGLKGQIEAVNIFMKGGLNEFLDLYPDLCPEFTGMISQIASKFAKMEAEGNFLGPWGESYEDEIKAVNQYFRQRLVFVYGTLMKGEANHRYLENSVFLGKTLLEGYDMYNVGWYPAIVAGDGLVVGEVYEVPVADIPSIDSLEGEGSLYVKKCERVTLNGEKVFALVYVYLGDCSGLEKIAAWNNEYVWYVSYGSNMLKERFMCYIEGGSYKGSRPHPPCNDTTPPVAIKSIEIPHEMYFGNKSRSWRNMGVSFLDVAKEGKSLGVAYLITKEQFDHVVYRENCGRPQNKYSGWYEDTIDLAPIDGFEVKTITNRDLRNYNEPCNEYWNTLVKGIKENWPEMSDEEIKEYLNSCIR